MSAGLGKDAHWIAYCGATVTLLERNPVLALLLQEAVDALRQDPDESAIGKRMAVIKTDAEAFLESLTSGTFDVAYYDPMFLPRQKSALVKKDMQIMHLLLGEEPSSDILLKVLDKIPKLVVKRAKADPIYSQTPHVNILAGLVRYEIYMSFDKTKFVVQS
jgi:16S rRNA (guanine1516-N2)-methyltransferase